MDLAGLQAALLLGDQAFDHRAFGQAAPVMLLEDAEMDQDVALGVVADDETEAAGRIEPLDGAGHPDQRVVVVAWRGFALRGSGGRTCIRFATRHDHTPINH